MTPTENPSSDYAWRASAVTAGVLGALACVLWFFLVSEAEAWSAELLWLPLFLGTWLGFAVATSVTARMMREAPLDERDGTWAFATPVIVVSVMLAGECVLALLQSRLLPLFVIVVLFVSVRGALRVIRAMWWPTEPRDRIAPDEVNDGRGSI